MVEAVEPAGGRGFFVAAGVGGVTPSTICSRRGEGATESSFCVSYFPQTATLGLGGSRLLHTLADQPAAYLTRRLSVRLVGH